MFSRTFLSTITACFFLLYPARYHGAESEKLTDHNSLPNQTRALMYFTCANTNMLLRNYEEALIEYEKTLSLIKDSENFEGIKFISLLSLVVISDKLFFPNECEYYLQELKKVTEDSCSFQCNAFEDKLPPLDNDYSRAAKDLKGIALMANSQNVQQVLVNYIDEMFPSLHYEKTKSLKRKLKRLSRKVKKEWDDWLDRVHRTLDDIERIKRLFGCEVEMPDELL